MFVYIVRSRLLANSDSIQEIALQCGFHDAAYFSRIYKKVMGIPPSYTEKWFHRDEGRSE